MIYSRYHKLKDEPKKEDLPKATTKPKKARKKTSPKEDLPKDLTYDRDSFLMDDDK